ncbi:hypothetical protein B0T19DRAFT_437066 [Cercophora scortea]|uniref:Uncharacterized protein n=1 Tax=Cercophora scortea TaxID=314031 RepID=A0AAE0J472_9PEZI|nr:hypothetical protein B0T19DRAFT_437066 [Cercophora scortea]
MKSSVIFLLFSGLAAGLAIPARSPDPAPSPEAETQRRLHEFYYGSEACHSVLTTCRVDSDCCPGMRCGTYDGEALCTPGH